MASVRWASMLLLIACGDATGNGRSREEVVTGFWSLTVRSLSPERIDLVGEVRVNGENAWYSLGRPRPINSPPCVPADLQLPENSDSVILILSPGDINLRRELRGVLQGDRILGQWFGPPSAGWFELQSNFALHYVRESSGLTEECTG